MPPGEVIGTLGQPQVGNGSLVGTGIDTAIMETIEERHARHTPTDDRNPWVVVSTS
jgi:hypothetical protein